ncbi:unnamed protein product, partial [Choristocarpus tenellus]
GSKAGRSGSVVYPEADDNGKPKVFARQSFQVSGEEEEMALTILEARHLVGERRRSKGEGADIPAVRRASLLTTTLPRPQEEEIPAEQEPEEATEKARRRSSVLNRIPEKLRTLVQQSDANGVQQQTELPPADSSETGGSGLESDQDGVARTSQGKPQDPFTEGSAKSHHQSCCSSLLGCMRQSDRWRHAKKGAEGYSGQWTPVMSPVGTEGDKCSITYLLPPQRPEHAGRKQLILDLDETLVHSSFKPVVGADYIIDIDVDGVYYKV